jgi:hypothetical protein
MTDLRGELFILRTYLGERQLAMAGRAQPVEDGRMVDVGIAAFALYGTIKLSVIGQRHVNDGATLSADEMTMRLERVIEALAAGNSDAKKLACVTK